MEFPPSLQDEMICSERYQPPCGWLISGVPAGREVGTGAFGFATPARWDGDATHSEMSAKGLFLRSGGCRGQRGAAETDL